MLLDRPEYVIGDPCAVAWFLSEVKTCCRAATETSVKIMTNVLRKFSFGDQERFLILNSVVNVLNYVHLTPEPYSINCRFIKETSMVDLAVPELTQEIVDDFIEELEFRGSYLAAFLACFVNITKINDPEVLTQIKV